MDDAGRNEVGAGAGSHQVHTRLVGAHVTVTSGSDDKLAAARKLGADDAINHAGVDVGRLVAFVVACLRPAPPDGEAVAAADEER